MINFHTRAGKKGSRGFDEKGWRAPLVNYATRQKRYSACLIERNIDLSHTTYATRRERELKRTCISRLMTVVTSWPFVRQDLPLDVPLKSEIFHSGSAQALPITAGGQRAFSISSVVSWNCSWPIYQRTKPI